MILVQLLFFHVVGRIFLVIYGTAVGTDLILIETNRVVFRVTFSLLFYPKRIRISGKCLQVVPVLFH